jgi:IS5 family transposase
VATTHREGFVLGLRSLPGNPYDGHTLHETLEQVEILTDRRPAHAFVDHGYRGHGIKPGTAVFISGQRRGMTRALRRALRRCVRRAPASPPQCFDQSSWLLLAGAA